jgi:hypothetical protein
MINKDVNGVYSFSVNGETFRIFYENGDVKLRGEDDGFVFNTLKNFRVFCNSITDIIENIDNK